MAKNVERGDTSAEVESGRTPAEILNELDLLRDRRFAVTVTEDEYHIEWDRLWDELRRVDRAARRLPRYRACRPPFLLR